MPIISKIGSRSLKVRLIYGTIFAVLLLGSVTIIYPFMLMLSGSTKSETDIARVSPYPQYWFNDKVLFQKYVESKYNVSLILASSAWGELVGNWQSTEPPAKKSEHLQDYLQWRKSERNKWWWLGHSGGGKMLPKNARCFRELLYEQFDSNITAFNQAMKMPLKSWNAVVPPPPPPTALRYPRDNEGLMKAFREYAAASPIRDRITGNPDGIFWNEFLRPKYTLKIEEYNKQNSTNYAGYDEVFLTKRAPKNPTQRSDWEEFVRDILPLKYIRITSDLSKGYRKFLKQKYLNISDYNRSKQGTKHTTFSEISCPTALPDKRSNQVDWQEFIADRKLCPLAGLEVYGPRQSFDEFLAEKYDKPLDEILPAKLPIAQADWHDCMANSNDLRWEFSTRNYKQVFAYLIIHGRGLPNTVIYCALAIGLALIVNPLTAYGLSRYKPPTTYTILLFCLATMAFPAEVTMIPGFLLLKRFPLWPLLGGGAAFGICVWLFSKWLTKMPELLRLTLAAGVGVLVGVWAVPAATGKPYVSLLNTFAALVLPTMANGYMIFLLKGFFDSLPREIYEAADLDGASEWTKFWSFTMALSKPILAVLALGAFVMAYTNFMMALIIIPDQKMWTMMVWLFQLQSVSHQSVQYASIAIAAIPTFFVFVVCQSVIIRGIVVPTEK